MGIKLAKIETAKDLQNESAKVLPSWLQKKKINAVETDPLTPKIAIPVDVDAAARRKAQSRRKDGDDIIVAVLHGEKPVDTLRLSNNKITVLGDNNPLTTRALVDELQQKGWSCPKVSGSPEFVTATFQEMASRGMKYSLGGTKSEQEELIKELVSRCKLNEMPMDLHNNASPALEKMIEAECIRQRVGMQYNANGASRMAYKNHVEASKLEGFIQICAEKNELFGLDSHVMDETVKLAIRTGSVPIVADGTDEFKLALSESCKRLGNIPLSTPQVEKKLVDIQKLCDKGTVDTVQKNVNKIALEEKLSAKARDEDPKNKVESADGFGQ
jgi:hypothetical protein